VWREVLYPPYLPSPSRNVIEDKGLRKNSIRNSGSITVRSLWTRSWGNVVHGYKGIENRDNDGWVGAVPHVGVNRAGWAKGVNRSADAVRRLVRDSSELLFSICSWRILELVWV